MELPIIETLKLQPSWVLLLSTLGLIATSNLLLSLLQWLHTSFLRRPKNLRRRYGSWAVVSGATDGIGRALALELSRRGLNLVLLGRNPLKLQEVSSTIQTLNPKTQVKAVVADFSGDAAAGIRRLSDTIQDLEVGLLVNSAGVTYEHGTYLHEDVELYWREKIVKVNVEGLSDVTMAVLPLMVARKRGAVVNVGSGASTVIPSHPLFSVYAASKAYVNSLSRNLHVEYKDKGIDVQCQIPLYVATKMVAFKKSSFFTPSPMVYARYAVDRIGYEHQTMPYWPHTIQALIVKLVPTFLINKWRLAYGLSRRQERFK